VSEPTLGAQSSGAARVATALVGGPILLAAVYLGGLWFLAVVLLIALISTYEVSSMFGAGQARPFVPAALVLAAIVVCRHWIPGWPMIAGAVAAATLASIPFVEGKEVPARAAATFFVVIYPAWLASFLVSIRIGAGLPQSSEALMPIAMLVFFLVWASDTFAYYTGKTLGKHPFFPAVSPKKTWEGFVGGFVGTFAVSLVAHTTGLVPLSLKDAIALALICGLVAPVGDLLESKLKRSFGVKDSGSILPGHGGVLDRFDGMVLCAPVVWAWLAYG
jgi:phosphatidate cytidylyltransferase